MAVFQGRGGNTRRGARKCRTPWPRTTSIFWRRTPDTTSRRSRSGTGDSRAGWTLGDSIHCRGFKQDCPDGQLSKDKILEMYSMILPAGNAKVFVDQIFRIFDKDGNGSIDFKVWSSRCEGWSCDCCVQEFMMATDMTASGSPEEKLRWAFKMYDKDGSGEWW